MEHASFNPAHTMPCCQADTPHYDTQPTSPRPVCHCLMFLSDSSESDQDTDSSPDSSSDEEEDFQTVPIDDEHWTTEMVLERTFCIHENGLPNNVCQYPCPYGNNNNSVSYMDSLELSNNSDYKDYMMTTSDDEELPGLEEVPYWTLVCLNTYLTFKLLCVALNFIHYCLNTDWDIYWNTNLTFLIRCTYSCMLSFKDNYCHFIITIIIIIIIIIILLSHSFNFNFVHTCIICHRSLLKYNIISETWCISIGLCLGVARGAWKHAPILPLPNYHASILHALPISCDIQNTPLINRLID